MPQDGSNNYQYPPGTRGVPDQTIESEAYNTFLDDLVVNDLNIPRPIHRGGTGATTANAAIYNLGGERAGAIVTNYDSHLWMSGSFYSAAGATGAPVPGRAFVGIAYSSDPPADPPTNLNVIVEARDQADTTVPGRLHIREKKAGVWGVWKGEDRLAVQTTPPSTVNSPDGALYWDNDNGVLFVNYNDGDTTQWVQAVALPQIDVSTFVAKAGDTMTGLLTLSGPPTVNLHAATKLYVDGGVDGVTGGLNSKAGLEALAYSGMQINGSMEVSQELGLNVDAIAITGTPRHGCDVWKITVNHSGQINVRQAPTTGGLPLGFSRYLRQTCASALATMATGNYVLASHTIEGSRWSRLGWGTANAMPVTIAFWVNCNNQIGTATLSVRHPSGSPAYCTNFTVNTINTWEYKVITIPGCTTATWEVDTLAGVLIGFCFGAGTSYHGTPNAWGSGSIATATTKNFWAVDNTACNLTGVIVLPGIYAPTAAQSPLIMRPYGEELATCQRYYECTDRNSVVQSIFADADSGASGTVTAIHTWSFKSSKRITPTIGYFGSFVQLNHAAAFTAIQTIDHVMHYQTAAAGNVRHYFYNNVNSGFTADARL